MDREWVVINRRVQYNTAMALTKTSTKHKYYKRISVEEAVCNKLLRLRDKKKMTIEELLTHLIELDKTFA